MASGGVWQRWCPRLLFQQHCQMIRQVIPGLFLTAMTELSKKFVKLFGFVPFGPCDFGRESIEEAVLDAGEAILPEQDADMEDGASSNKPIGRVLAECEQPIDIHWAP